MADLILRTQSSAGVGDDPFNSATVTTKGTPVTLEELDDNLIHLQNSKENQLGPPSADGYLLSSTAAGVRSWVEPLMDGTVDGSFLIWDTVTEKWLENTNILYLDNDAHSWGSGNTAVVSLSTAFGFGNTASNTGATAWGSVTQASGVYSTSWGVGTQATGAFSTSWGTGTQASNTGSTASGFATISSGHYSTTFGALTQASGDNSLATGFQNTASGAGSTVFGVVNTVSGDYSLAAGSQNIVSGDQSYTFGSYVEVQGDKNFVVCFDNGPTRTTISGDRQFVVTEVEAVSFNSNTPVENTFNVQMGRIEKLERDVTARTITKDDYMISCASGVQTYTLPANPETGRVYRFMKQGDGDTKTINGNGNNINGSPSITLTSNYHSRKMVFNGSEWIIIDQSQL